MLTGTIPSHERKSKTKPNRNEALEHCPNDKKGKTMVLKQRM